MKNTITTMFFCLLISACSPSSNNQIPTINNQQLTQGQQSNLNQESQNQASNSNQGIENHPSNSLSQIKISADEAKQIAFNQVSGTLTELSTDFDEYIPKYEVSIVNGVMEYQFDISAIDGSILGYSTESIYD